MTRLGAATAVAALVASCAGASRPLPRLERYDFLGETPADLVRLRQIATADDEGGAAARYALARAHVDWLALALVQEREDDGLLRALAVDLGVDGASVDDRLALDQLLATMDRVLAEVDDASSAGGEARRWTSAVERLLRGLRAGWEEFGPELFRAVAEASEEPGPARVIADLLAVGWSRVAFDVLASRPPSDRARFLVRMAAFHDPGLVEWLATAEAGADLWDAPVDLGCEASGSRGRSESMEEHLERVRRVCGGERYGLAAGDEARLTPELALVARVIVDLAARRSRLEAASADPLVQASQQVLAAFDASLARLRVPLPIPLTAGGYPTVPRVEGERAWRPGAAVVMVGGDGAPRVEPWPTLGVVDGAPRLLDRSLDRSEQGTLAERIASTFEASRERLGRRDRILSIVTDRDLPAARFFELLEACRRAEADAVDVIVRAGDRGLGSLAVTVSPGAASARTSADRRALVVIGAEGLQVGTADGGWRELQDDGGPAVSRLLAALAGHVGGRGNPGCIVSPRADVPLSRLVVVLDALARAPRSHADDATRGWDVQLDPEEPAAPLPVADTVAGAVDLHRVRLRQCYERFLRSGGRGQGAVVLTLAVGAEGRVTSARVVDTELGPQPALDNCLVGEAQRIRFPATAEGSVVRVPLRFVPR